MGDMVVKERRKGRGEGNGARRKALSEELLVYPGHTVHFSAHPLIFGAASFAVTRVERFNRNVKTINVAGAAISNLLNRG